MTTVSIKLDKDETKVLKKRAKKNLMSLKEQVEDIIRRSCVNSLRNTSTRRIKIDDRLVSVFSREKRRKRK